MTKKIIILSGVLLLVPACKNGTRFSSRKTTTSQTVVGQSQYDEELGAFVVKDDENSFNAALNGELKAEGSDLRSTDLRSDSAKYGLKTIYFGFDKYKINELSHDQKPVLAHDIQVVKSLVDKGYRIILEGHACESAGSTAYNMTLSEKRAKAVHEALEQAGIHGNVHVVGRGCEHLIVPSGDQYQQAPNRRVEIYADLS